MTSQPSEKMYNQYADKELTNVRLAGTYITTVSILHSSVILMCKYIVTSVPDPKHFDSDPYS